MRAPVQFPIVIAAGGTGGHFFPAEALAAGLIARDERVILMTDARSGGLTSAVFAQAERHVLAGAGLSGRSFGSALNGAVKLARGVAQARRLLKSIRPAAIVAFGGYPAISPVLAAATLRPRPKIYLHEQNAVLGRANRLLARFADCLVLSFANTASIPAGVPTLHLGNPVRPALAALYKYGYVPPDGLIELFIIGGSLGAKIFGTLIPAALALLPVDLKSRLRVVQQCRAQEHDAAAAAFATAGINVTLSPFFHDVAAQYQRAHLVIARAGASSVAELAVAGRPALFIPLPTAIDDHQRANADALVSAGAAWRLDQSGLTPEILAERLTSLLTAPDQLAAAARAASAAGVPDAAARFADLVQSGLPAGERL